MARKGCGDRGKVSGRYEWQASMSWTGAAIADGCRAVSKPRSRPPTIAIAFGDRQTVSPQQLGRDEKVGRRQEIWTPATIESAGA